MIRTTSLAIALALPALALAQDSRPAQEKQTPALDLIADALLEAHTKKVLGPRLLEEQIFFSEGDGGGPAVVRVSGAADAEGFRFKLNVTVFSRRELKIEFLYTFDAMGRLRGVSLTNGDRKQVGVVKGGKLVVLRERGEKSEETSVAWRTDALPSVLTVFLLPALADQGLPATVKGAFFRETSMGRDSAYRNEATFSKGEQVKEGKQTYDSYSLKSPRGDVVARVYAAGEHKGKVARIDMEREGRYERVSESELKERLKTLPLLKNEAATCSALRGLCYAQRRVITKNNKASDRLEDFKDEGITEENFKGYEVFLRSSPDGSKWMAVAVPRELNKTGRYYFVINGDEKVFRSKKEIQLNDECTIPKDLEQVGR